MNWSSFVTATFPSGRLFDWLSIGGTFAYIITADGEIKHAQEVVEYPTWPVGQKDFMDTGFNLSMIVDGKKETVRVDLTPHHFYWTWMTPSQFCAGAEPERAEKEKLWIAKEMLAKFTWDGEMTYGLIEMTRRFGTSEKG